MLETMIYDDIAKGHGVAVIDPHGDLADTLVDFMPRTRTNDVILFDPSDTNFPIAFNMLEDVSPELRPIVASGLVGIFKRMFSESWGPRLEHILRNTVLTLLEVPQSTLLSIPQILTQKSYRKKIISWLTDPVLVRFWEKEFEPMNDRQRVEAVGPILNKIGQFLSSYLVRNIVGQPKNSFHLRWAMDKKKIVIVNLSKWRIGEDSSNLLGAMLITKFQIDAMSRADIPETERQDYYLYVDEFQNFATDSFATILSEARKYKLNLIMANQYIDQMSETVRWAVFGNVWTLVSFQVGYNDAQILSKVLGEEIVTDNDLMNLKKYTTYTNLMIDGMPSRSFSAQTFPPVAHLNPDLHQSRDKIMKVSRDRYAKDRKKVEQHIQKTTDDTSDEESSHTKKKSTKRKEESGVKKKNEK